MKLSLYKIEIFLSAVVVCAVLFITHNNKTSSLLYKVKSENKLVIVTRNSPTTYYIGPSGPTGFEYDLAKQFANFLGVELEVIVQNEFHKILPSIVRGDAHIGAAGITHTKQREAYINFGPEYTKVVSQIAYKSGKDKPNSIVDLPGKRIAVVKGSTHAQMLLDHKEFFPDLEWKEYPEITTDELMLLTSDELIDYTITDSNELAVTRRYYPKLNVAFDLGPEQSLSWALQKSDDASLQNAVNDFFVEAERNGSLTSLREKHFGHVNDIKPIDSHTFLSKLSRIFMEF